MAQLLDLNKGEKVLLKAASIGVAVLGIVSVYVFYMNNIWKPKIVVKRADFVNGIADLEIDGKPFVLRGDSTYLVRFDWGVRLGYTTKRDGSKVYDRIEILKRGMVVDVVRR